MLLPEIIAVSRSEAGELMRRGGLWNNSVMVGTISTFLRKIRRAMPEIYAAFKTAAPQIGTPGEEMAMRRIYYENYTGSDLARDVLQKNAVQLAVVPVSAVKVQRQPGRNGREGELYEMFVFQFKGKEYRGVSALDIVSAMESDTEQYPYRGQSLRQFLLWSLKHLGHRLPPRDLHLSDQLEDDELALSYLYLRDEYGAGKLLTDAEFQA